MTHCTSGIKAVDEIFFLRAGDQYIGYAPLHRVIFIANASLVEAVSHMQSCDSPSEHPRIQWAKDQLAKLGIQINEAPDIPSDTSDDPYLPSSVTFIPTHGCNLKCIYCYADSSQYRSCLEPSVAERAIDLVVKNATSQGRTTVNIGLLGGGEPFMAWDLVQHLVDYGKSAAEEAGIDTYFSAVTNGVLRDDQVKWIAANFQNLSVSLDGTRVVHDAARPMRSGGGSWERVTRTLEMLNELEYKYSVRATVSSRSLDDMESFVNYLAHDLHVDRIHFEPLFACGRCSTDHELVPDPGEFVERFKLCLGIVASTTTELLCSAVRLDSLTDSFCGALAGNFYVTPEGYVTACTEVSSPEHELSSMFFVGQYDAASRNFVFKEDRVRRLATRKVANMEGCRKCLAKWHCAGACPAKAAQAGEFFDAVGIDNCRIARELTEHYIRSLASGSGLRVPNIIVRSIGASNEKGGETHVNES